jgi:MFS family permease
VKTVHLNPVLLRAQASFFTAFVAEWAFTVAIGLVAYAHGGALAVGIVGVARLVPAGLLAPFLAAYGDKVRREHLLITLSLVRAVATAAIWAVLMAGSTMVPVYVLAAISQIAFTPFRGTHSALLPSLCRTPEELTSVNIVRGALDSLSIVLGPLLAAGIVATTDVAWVFIVAAGFAFVSAAMLVGVSYERLPVAKHHVVKEMAEGLRRVVKTPGLRLVVGLMALQTAIRGAYTVFVVVVALNLLHRAGSVAGVLQATLGVGAFIAALLCGRYVTGAAMARWLGFGILLWSLPLAALGLAPSYVAALLASAAIGGGKATVDLAAFTLIPRMTPDRVLARVFGALESIIALSVGLASLATPLLSDAVGIKDALLIVGLTPTAFVLIAWPALNRIDNTVQVSTKAMNSLREVAMLRPLPVPVLERLVRHMRRVTCDDGHVVFSAGDHGSAYYVIAKGSVEIRDGQTVVRELGKGEGFGEIALLSEGVRTMSVVAIEHTELLEIDRADFLVAVTSFGDAGSAARAVSERYLAHAPGLAGA